jgi:hypothetical protein
MRHLCGSSFSARFFFLRAVFLPAQNLFFPASQENLIPSGPGGIPCRCFDLLSFHLQ